MFHGFNLKLYITSGYTQQKNEQLVAMLIKTRLNNIFLPILFNVFNNIAQNCYT